MQSAWSWAAEPSCCKEDMLLASVPQASPSTCETVLHASEQQTANLQSLPRVMTVADVEAILLYEATCQSPLLADDHSNTLPSMLDVKTAHARYGKVSKRMGAALNQASRCACTGQVRRNGLQGFLVNWLNKTVGWSRKSATLLAMLDGTTSQPRNGRLTLRPKTSCIKGKGCRQDVRKHLRPYHQSLRHIESVRRLQILSFQPRPRRGV